jgi:hypothetical protein
VVAITWVKPRGAEYASVNIDEGRLHASGVAIGASPLPYHLYYELTCGDDYVTRSLHVRTTGPDWSRGLQLNRHDDGSWRVTADFAGAVDLSPPGGDPAVLAGALDCDLGECPVTNTMPVLRHGLLAGGAPMEFVMAWVSVPDLSVRASNQRYTFLRRLDDGAVINYAAGSFSADVTFDADGLVTDYPGMAARA